MENAYIFAKKIENSQENHEYRHNILFNKGRYFETTILNSDILKQVSELTQLPIQYGNMIIGNADRLQDFVTAMNCFNISVKINVDWI